MTITAQIIADSVSHRGARITTFVLRYPRFVHAELLTHRMLSRNSASSRAIPLDKAIAAVVEDPATPSFWGSNRAGMVAGDELAEDQIAHARQIWLAARDAAVLHARALGAANLHKQHASRIIEPFSHITTVVTATDWANFYRLRRAPDALPEFRALADAMHEAHSVSTPVVREPATGEGGWHLPFVTGAERQGLELTVPDLCAISVGRCARVSYLTHDGRRDPAEDRALCVRLSQNGHWSPFEHVALALDDAGEASGNFHGWRQYRKCYRSEHPHSPGAVFPE